MSHRKFTDEQALEAIKDKNCISVAAVLRKLGFQKVSGPRHALIKKIAAKYRIDTSHWLGCRYMLGKVSVNRKPLSMILVLNGSKIRSHDVKLRILRDGLKPHQCEKCKKKRWNGQPIPLDLHHKNGNRQEVVCDYFVASSMSRSIVQGSLVNPMPCAGVVPRVL